MLDPTLDAETFEIACDEIEDRYKVWPRDNAELPDAVPVAEWVDALQRARATVAIRAVSKSSTAKNATLTPAKNATLDPASLSKTRQSAPIEKARLVDEPALYLIEGTGA
jgi:hypothetical protein